MLKPLKSWDVVLRYVNPGGLKCHAGLLVNGFIRSIIKGFCHHRGLNESNEQSYSYSLVMYIRVLFGLPLWLSCEITNVRRPEFHLTASHGRPASIWVGKIMEKGRLYTMLWPGEFHGL